MLALHNAVSTGALIYIAIPAGFALNKILKMKKNISSKTVALTFGILVICFAVGFYIFAWTGPTAPPPEGNVSPPIRGEVKVWSDGVAKNCGAYPCAATCSLTVPAGYTVVYGHAGCTTGPACTVASFCQYPSVGDTSLYPCGLVCSGIGLGTVGPNTVTKSCSSVPGDPPSAQCGLYLVAIKLQ